MAAQPGILASQVAPAYLASNATSHTWVFSAIAELIDNAYDPDVKASVMWISHVVLGTMDCLVFTDNGKAMEPQKLHKMLSFGYCEKEEVRGHKPIGHYGNGFKSGSMRLGKDAIVFTRQKQTMSVGFLSQTFLKAIGATTVLVPIVSWETETRVRLDPNGDFQASLDSILKYSSLFKSEDDLLKELDSLFKNVTGTRIMIYNLLRRLDGRLELDLESDPQDIRDPDTAAIDENNARPTDRPLALSTNDYTKSLREYCSILYKKPRMKIMLRGKKVTTRLVSKSLSRTERDLYKPRCAEKPMQIIYGFGRIENSGMLLYHRNRLIKAYEKVGPQKQPGGEGLGVVGVAEVDFLEPTHNKQDFKRTEVYSACMSALGHKLKDYWRAKTEGLNGAAPAAPVAAGEAGPPPDWLWVQCDNPQCLKWRRLPASMDKASLPQKWYCMMNPDQTHNRCDIEEEPEDEDDLMRPSYLKPKKTPKPNLRIRMNMAEDIKPNEEELKRELQETKNREKQQRAVINKLVMERKSLDNMRHQFHQLQASSVAAAMAKDQQQEQQTNESLPSPPQASSAAAHSAGHKRSGGEGDTAKQNGTGPPPVKKARTKASVKIERLNGKEVCVLDSDSEPETPETEPIPEPAPRPTCSTCLARDVKKERASQAVQTVAGLGVRSKGVQVGTIKTEQHAEDKAKLAKVQQELRVLRENIRRVFEKLSPEITIPSDPVGVDRVLRAILEHEQPSG